MRSRFLWAACAVNGIAASIAGAAIAPTPNWAVQTTDVGAPSVARTPDGGFYVGTTDSSFLYAVLERYNPYGASVWRTKMTSAQTQASQVASDAAGNAYLAGTTYSSLDGINQGLSDVFVRKYSSSNAVLWRQQVGTSLYDMSQGLAVSPSGDTFLTNGPWATNYGVPPAGTYNDVHRISATGTRSSPVSLNTNDGTYPGMASGIGGHAVAVDSKGNAVSLICNYTNVNNSITGYNYLARTDTAGNVQLLKRLPDLGNLVSIALDKSDNVYVAGNGITKFDTGGNVVWRVTGKPYTVFADCVAPDGTVYVAGYGANTAGAVAAYTPDGQEIWYEIIPRPSGTSALWFYDMTLSGNNLVVAGRLATGSYWSGNEFVSIPVPEPTGITLVAGSGLLLLLQRRTMRRVS